MCFVMLKPEIILHKIFLKIWIRPKVFKKSKINNFYFVKAKYQINKFYLIKILVIANLQFLLYV